MFVASSTFLAAPAVSGRNTATEQLTGFRRLFGHCNGLTARPKGADRQPIDPSSLFYFTAGEIVRDRIGRVVIDHE